MIGRLADLFPTILTAALGALVAGPLLTRLARRSGLVDQPGSAPHKKHSSPTPMAGGAVLAAGVALPILVLGVPLTTEVSRILGLSAVVLALGLIDDRWGLRPYQKILGQVLIALLVIAAGVQVRVTRLPAVDVGLTVLWVVGMMNAFNFVDSMDGLAVGLAMIAAAFFMLATIDSRQPSLSFLAAAVLGAGLGVYLYNASPASLFLGDSGAQWLGYLLAAVGVAYVPAQAGLPQGVSWFTPILVVGVPIFDMALVVYSRLRRRRPLYVAGQDHTYHRLVSMGLHPTRSVVLMQLAAVMLGLAAFIALDASVLVANLIFAGLVAAGLVLVIVLERPRLVVGSAGPVTAGKPADQAGQR